MLTSKKHPRKALSEIEHKIMQVLWKQGPVNSEQVRQALAARHPMKDSTIRTMLRRMQEKGYVKHRNEGRAFIYSVVEAPQNRAVRAFRQSLYPICEGSLEQLLTGLVENEVVNRAELQEL